MQVKNKSKRRFEFAEFEIKAGEIVEVEADLQEDAKKLIEMYPRDLEAIEVKKVKKAKKAEPKAEEVKAEAK